MSESKEVTLNALALEIKANLKEIGVKTFKTGALLLEAKGSFDKSSDFLKWSESKIGLKKAQTYKLMKIATTFADDEELQVLSATALYTLTTASEDVLDTIRAIVSDGGVVTNEVLEGILYPSTDAIDTNDEVQEEDNEQDVQEDEGITPTQKKINTEVNKAISKVEKEHAKTTAKLEKVEGDKDALIKAKRSSDRKLIKAEKVIETTQQKLDKALAEVKTLKSQIKEFQKAIK